MIAELRSADKNGVGIGGFLALENTFEHRIADYLSERLGVGTVSVASAERIVGGGSRHTWKVQADWRANDGSPSGRTLIFRLDPEGSLLESNRHSEFEFYSAFWHSSDVPVPEPLFIEDDVEILGNPFCVMAAVAGIAEPATIVFSTDYDQGRAAIARQWMELLGEIASVDYRAMGLHEHTEEPLPDTCWEAELEHWEQVLRDHYVGPYPVNEAAIRWLRRNPPPPAQRVSVVHGDYRVGNFLATPDRIEAIVDWEMAHLGDPHQDLAWAFARNWRFARDPELVGGLLSQPEAIEIWESSSDLTFDADAMHWWGILNHIKANAIWITGAHSFATGRTRDPLYAIIEWRAADMHDMWILKDMGVVP